ncbi:protein kinase subdomain-containing protein PKL/CAK/ChoK [Coprinopsis marcescibilis]|uniref:Protein kinase subdomain-containing protein PKL/CAK/ChoK n=1 Tax=Coprinopsis marcescibilis TaxID=230819 RepID=A0A5C3KR58_COPMA|nr:protein kinase subdomain-containing protein PKL/CAK/ChoK [Coprinopsis marcescibilis]
MSPIISVPSPTNSVSGSRTCSTGSVSGLTGLLIGASSSSLNLPEGPVEPVKAEGIPHVKLRLEARQYKTPEFASRLLGVASTLKVQNWNDKTIKSENLIIRRISGALTNAVFYVYCRDSQTVPKLLLRIYGASSAALISRPRELHILHKLSSIYHIGPIVYGTFENGRLEEYFESTTLTADDIRDPTISRWIGARMAEFHSVDISVVSPPSDASPSGWGMSLKTTVSSWMSPAQEVLALPAINPTDRQELDLARFDKEWKIYMHWVSRIQDKHSGSNIVFAHNDTQYGNLLRLSDTIKVADEHRQLIVVDFEYAGPNPAAYDIANHFHERTANYHGPTPHLLDRSRYPTFAERRNFYSAYIHHSTMLGEDTTFEKSEFEQLIAALDYQVRIWSPASHAMWAIWGIVQAREDAENNVQEAEFDYIGYAKGRMAYFRQEILELGVVQR